MTPVLDRPRLTSVVPNLAPATLSVDAEEAIRMAEAGEMVPWEGVIVVEGTMTGDRRIIDPGGLEWGELPLPLMSQTVTPVGGSGHDGAVLAGRIDNMVRIDGNRVWANGYVDPMAPGGLTLVYALARRTMRGISVDLDNLTLVSDKDRMGRVDRIVKARVRGATATPFAAFVEASIHLATDALTASVFTPFGDEGLVAAGGLRHGSTIPVDPPMSWFEKPSGITKITPFTITADGRMFGHIAAWGTCHISFSNRCVPVPRSRTNYAAFRNGSVLTAEGTEVRTGPIIMDTVHPDLRWRASDAQAFYADTGSAVADVVPYEDKFGIWLSGALRPNVTPEQVRALRASDISPDWRTVNGSPRECVAMLVVNTSGFKVPQTLAAAAGEFIEPGHGVALELVDDEFEALVASLSTVEAMAELADDGDCGCGCGGGCADEAPAAEPTVRTFRLARRPTYRRVRL